jgi:hypothetical protein
MIVAVGTAGRRKHKETSLALSSVSKRASTSNSTSNHQEDAIADNWAPQSNWMVTDEKDEIVIPPTAVPVEVAAELSRFVGQPSRLPSQPQ